MLDKVRVSGVKILQKRVGESDTEARVNSCREGEYIESFEGELNESSEEMWEERADKFCSEGEVVRSDQRASLWHVIEQFRRVFAEIPGRAKGYECVLQVREHTPLSLIHI